MGHYPSSYPARARELHDAGWRNCTEIARLLERELGRRPAQTTIRRWVDPDHADVIRTRQRRGGVCGPSRRLPAEQRLKRLSDLRELGLTYRALAAVANYDFGTDLTHEQVEGLLRGEFTESTNRRLLYPQGASR